VSEWAGSSPATHTRSLVGWLMEFALSPELASRLRETKRRDEGKKGVPDPDVLAASSGAGALVILRSGDGGKGTHQGAGGAAEVQAAPQVVPPDSWEGFDESTLVLPSTAPSVLEEDEEDEAEYHGLRPLDVVEEAPRPVLLVDLSAICGFVVPPSEAAEVVKHLTERLAMSFTKRSEELFEIGAAQHSTSDVAMEDATWGRHRAILPYPDILDNGSSTREVWNDICRAGSLPCVESILVQLRKCGRDLIWKHEMRIEIERLAEREQAIKMGRWQRVGRRRQLRRLVAARPALEERLRIEDAVAARDDEGTCAAQAAAAGLAHKLEQVDTLIAELELAEVEDGREPIGSDDEADSETDEQEEAEDQEEEEKTGGGRDVGVMDSILAMILGRLPRKVRTSEEEHAKHLLGLHQALKARWLAEFGRLPSPHSGS
jgi:hypothetical protein